MKSTIWVRCLQRSLSVSSFISGGKISVRILYFHGFKENAPAAIRPGPRPSAVCRCKADKSIGLSQIYGICNSIKSFAMKIEIELFLNNSLIISNNHKTKLSVDFQPSDSSSLFVKFDKMCGVRCSSPSWRMPVQWLRFHIKMHHCCGVYLLPSTLSPEFSSA